MVRNILLGKISSARGNMGPERQVYSKFCRVIMLRTHQSIRHNKEMCSTWGGHAFSSFALSLFVPVKKAIFALSLILPTHLTHRYRVSMGGQFNSVTRGMKSGLSISRQKKRVPSSDYLLFGNSLRNIYYLHPCTVQLNFLYVVNDIVMMFRYWIFIWIFS